MEKFLPVENFNFQLLKIGDIAGTYYRSPLPTDTVIIYGIGAPIPSDNGHLPDVPIINFGYQTFFGNYEVSPNSNTFDTAKLNCLLKVFYLSKRLSIDSSQWFTYLDPLILPSGIFDISTLPANIQGAFRELSIEQKKVGPSLTVVKPLISVKKNVLSSKNL